MRNIFIIVGIIVAAGAIAQDSAPPQPMFVKYEDAKWQKIIPELGDDGPDTVILRVDPKTQATQLMIRAHKAMHVPIHWHTGNETHTMIKGEAAFECGGHRETLGVGGFNYLPAKHQHQAWISADSLTFITVDCAWDVNWVNGPPTANDLGDAAVADALKAK